MKFKPTGKHNCIKTSTQRAANKRAEKTPYKSRKKPRLSMKEQAQKPEETSVEDRPPTTEPTPEVTSGESIYDKTLDEIRSGKNLGVFDTYIKELTASQACVSKMMGVLLPGHRSTRELVQAVWEGLHAHFQEEDWKLTDYSSLSSTIQRLTSMQNQFDALEMRRLEFARDHKALTEFSQKAMEAIRRHADTLSPETLVEIEQTIKTL